MNEKIKSPSQNSAGVAGSNTGGSSNATSTGSPASGLPIPNNGNDQQNNPHPYGPSVTEPTLSHYHLHQPPHSQHISHQPSNATGLGQNPSDHQSNKDEYNPNPLSAPPPPPGGHHPVYGRFHHGDPNIDPYRYGHSMQQPPPGGKPQSHSTSTAPSGTIPSPGRPSQQRYIPGQPPQGPTPTLNSLLQSSHPPPPQHRYSNSYDAQQQVSPQQPVGPQGSHVPPPPPPSHQSYPTQQQGGWAPPPRPYSPQLGPSQAYRTPPPANTSRGQSSYPSSHGQNAGSYPSSPQQSGGPPPQSSNQGTVTSQYTPYPQRYPTPPAGPNHRNAFSTHQYPDPNRPWPGGSSPAPSPGAGTHPHPPASPHQSQHGGPQPSSPGHAPSPSPQPSPQQELIGQNSNDSSSGGGHSSMPTGPPGTPNPQQVMRPTPSPTSSSGSRSMSPAVAQNHPASRPSSNQSSSSVMPQQGNSGQPPSHVLQNTSGQQQPLPPTQLGPGGPSSVINSSPTSNNSQQPMGSNLASGVPQQSQPPPNQNVNNTPPPPQSSALGSYIQPSHIYKMGVPGPSAGQNAGPVSQGYNTPQQSPQYTQGNYPPRPQYPPSNYASNQAPASQPIPTSNMPPGSQPFSGRPIPNHGGNNPHAQYPYQNWVTSSGTPTVAPSGGMGNHVQGKGTPPPLGVPSHQGGGSPRPLNYLKQHLQHKGGYASSPTPPQGYGNGSPMHAAGMPMGPPHHMGPPSTNMGPPVSTPPQSIGGVSVPVNENSTSMDHLSQDNGISSSSSSATSASHPVTSVITTGPDGTPMDEVSQQSTLSNASAASGEDPQCTTPKSRKSDPYSQSHLAPPCTSPSSHPGHPVAGAEDYEMNSPPNWTRTAASPVFNSHVPSQESFRSSTKKSDSLCKLYEMDENPERRGWLDKLRAFMEERRTPITACPTISKQPLDLYRLYIYVKERGGFVEVTKSKTWKDIAGLLGIGASSSAAYTLRKHYTKNLLAFECHFDRGDIDPLPIIQQVEAGTKKKTTKTVSVPSPVNAPSQTGSSNSQDSFSASGAAPNAAMEGYPGYPAGYPNATQTDYSTGNQLQRPPSQTNAQAPHPGSPYPGQAGNYGQYGAGDQYNASGPPAQFPQNQGQFAPQNRNMYPYGPEAEPPPTGSNQYGPYGNRHYSPSPSGGAQTPNPPGSNVNAANVASNPVPPSGSYSPGPAQPEYYRPPDQPRRHPDFVKDSQPYPGYNTRPQIYGGWQAGTPQYRGQYPSAPSPQTWVGAPRTAVPPTGPLGPPTQQPPTQWEQHRYSPQQAPQPQQSPYQQQNQQQPPPQWAQMGGSQTVQSGPPGSAIRPPGGQQQQRMPTGGPGLLSSQQAGPQMNQSMPSNVAKQQFSMPPPQSNSGAGPGVPPNPVVLPPSMVGPPKSGVPLPHASGPGQQAAYQPSIGTQLTKKDIIFPPDSVEATTSVLYRRKRLNKADICPVDPWRLFMAMRSGLLTECTWALDVLNILLFDDSTVQYFGLAHLPGLLTLLLEHFQKNLAEMFNDIEDNRRVHSICNASVNKRKRHYEDDINNECIDLGQITEVPKSEDRILLLSHTPNYTMLSRKGLPVRITPAEDDIFISDEQKPWDIDTDKLYEQMLPIGSNPWTYGLSEHSSHDGIIDVFKSEIINIPFARHIKRSCDSTKDDSINKNITNGYNKGKEHETPQQILNKKRRLFNNSKTLDSTASTPSFDQCNSTNIKSNNDNTSFVQPVIKKESHIDVNVATQDQSTSNSASDSDCREVDMDIEVTHRISHGNKNEISCNLKNFDPKSTARDPSLILKRRRDSSYEDECYTRDEASLYLVNESQDSLARRCICISNIFRNLTFIPGNETILAKSSRFLAILGRLLLLNHDHLQRTPKTRNYDREEDTDFSDSCSSLQGECEWWWDYLISIRENMLVAIANIAGHLELSRYEELIARPLIDGLLHWAVCPSAHSQDPFPSCGTNSALSPQRLALEALCKLCVTDANVDLVIATPPHSRLEKLCAVLTRHLCRNEDQVLREFSVNLLHYLAAADSAMARTVALQSPCISYLVAFIEQAEQTALGVANQHGINYLRETPESMGTSLDMLRRAAGTLLHLAKHPDNRSLFMQQEQRLLGLVMSHILDQQVALIISRVLFQVSRGPGPLPSMEFRLLQRQQKCSNENKPNNNKNLIIKADARTEVVQFQKKITPTSTVTATTTATTTAILTSTSSTSITTITTNTNTISSVAVTVADENSNSSNHLPSAVNFNDVSNSSTNSNSCGTTSSQSNVSSNSNTGNIKNNIELTASVNDTSSSDHHETILGSNNKSMSTTASSNLDTTSYNNNSNSNNNTEVSINTDSNINSSNNNNAGLSSSVPANAQASSSAAPPPPPSTTTTAVA